jgi:hypothetical protein
MYINALCDRILSKLGRVFAKVGECLIARTQLARFGCGENAYVPRLASIIPNRERKTFRQTAGKILARPAFFDVSATLPGTAPTNAFGIMH